VVDTNTLDAFKRKIYEPVREKGLEKPTEKLRCGEQNERRLMWSINSSTDSINRMACLCIATDRTNNSPSMFKDNDNQLLMIGVTVRSRRDVWFVFSCCKSSFPISCKGSLQKSSLSVQDRCIQRIPQFGRRLFGPSSRLSDRASHQGPNNITQLIYPTNLPNLHILGGKWII